MADPDARRTKRVSNSAIDEIRKLGMSKAIAKYTSGGGDSEFRTAVERYYSPQRLKAASKAAASSSAGKSTSSPRTSNASSSRPAPSQAAVSRRVAGNAVGAGVVGRRNAEYVSRNVTKPVGRALSTSSAVTKANTAGARKATGNWLEKNVLRGLRGRKRK